MKDRVNYLPDGFHSLQAVINVADFDSVLRFVKQVFGATEIERFDMPGGTTVHVEVKIGDSILVMGPPDPAGEFVAKIFAYVDNVDSVYQAALARHGLLRHRQSLLAGSGRLSRAREESLSARSSGRDQAARIRR